MTDAPAPNVAEADYVTSWEQRHKHAAFYQTQVNAVQQAALAFNTSVTVLITIGLAMSKLSDLAGEREFIPIAFGAFAWLILTYFLTNQHQRFAGRVRARYEEEHALLFPGLLPYQLESYLLRYCDAKSAGKVRRGSATPR